jgi:hypothetical protein
MKDRDWYLLVSDHETKASKVKLVSTSTKRKDRGATFAKSISAMAPFSSILIVDVGKLWAEIAKGL